MSDAALHGGRGRRGGGITVAGSGRADAAVDHVEVDLAVQVLHADAGRAFRATADGVTRVLAVLADGGVDSRSVRTTNVTLGPRTDYQNGRETVIGYAAAQQLVVSLSGLSGLERLLSDVVGQGGDGVRIDGVRLSVADPAQALALAREQAFADAAAKAEHLARLAGRRLGEVVWIEEAGGERPGGGPRLFKAMQAAGAAAAMPVASGDAALETSVVVRWRLAG